ncbi:putative ATP-dependent RNA helicase TDRD12 isoform X1 [Ornithorhynchus anatinus]|uniref:Putative ATP-dependent RNA helicase TDRD12 n=1 Tax=Ornithorhynchus anatinus TaxID=9258 RepID=K7EB31_ORNAN|nr:putative ATP-dependent RNA helicase TDRD12 isoform X1 [Ornithorhynchus anatinus]XP_007669682.2 putative ATP-dependent RNA helicase TDRD12 isoform X1 [Ornithorhynchus anatinus]
MIEVGILKIEDPGCFWVTKKGHGPFLNHEMEYQKLTIEMNNFYNHACRGEDLKPLMLEEGQVCVVYCVELKSWCRAVVKSIMPSADHHLAECFLVDFAKYIPVKTKNIRVALETFMQLPYRAKKFRLYCTKPVTLHINIYKDNAEIVPAKRWDSAAILYFNKILKATTQIEAKLCAEQEDFFDVYLYVTIKNEKICVNDELVAKNFACYDTPKESKFGTPENIVKCTTKINSKPLPSEINPALALWPTLFQEKIPECLGASIASQAPKLPIGDFSPKQVLGNECKEKEHISSNEINNSTVTSGCYLPKRDMTNLADSVEQTASVLSPKLNENQSKWTKKRGCGERNGCVKLLQFLNPDPIFADGTHYLQKPNISMQQPFTVLRNKIEPCSTFETAPLSRNLKKALRRNKFQGPNHTESYCWPPIARGCDSVVISHHGKDPLLYIPPILTFMQIGNCYKSLPSRNGPLAVILCPGWKKAMLVFDLLTEYSRGTRPLHPMLVLVGLYKEEAKNMKLQKGCEVIITTPHSLSRLLKYHSLLFLRICHLIFDEVEALFLEASEQMHTILDYFKKMSIERDSSPHQIVAVGTHWSKHLEILIKEFMNDPYIVITALEEAALYGNVQQVVHLCLEYEKTSPLLQFLDFTPSVTQKTLIFTSSVDEEELIYKAVVNSSIFCIKSHRDMGFDSKNVLEQWKKKFSSGTHVVLVLTDDCIPSLAITDATCVIHFNFPNSPRIYGDRLYCMSDNFQNLIEQGASVEQGVSKAKSILLLTEKSACHAVGILRYLERTDASIPPELCNFTAGVLEAKEDMKVGRPLCQYLKDFGFCKNKRMCPDRHRINTEVDIPNIFSEKTPNDGYITIIPFYIVNATNYFGRIIDKYEDLYAHLSAEMNEYFKESTNKVPVKKVEKLKLYALYEKTLFHRVQVLKIGQEENRIFFNVQIKYIDEGRTDNIKSYHLLHLPERFHSIPPQAVEFIVCRVKPIDNEIDWSPKVTRYIHNKIKGTIHEAKIVLSLGNTVWIDPMIHVTRLSDLKTSIIEYNIRSEILSLGMGTDNPEHAENLKKLFEEAKTATHEESTIQNSIFAKSPDTVKKLADDLQSTETEDEVTKNASSEMNPEDPKSDFESENKGQTDIKGTASRTYPKSYNPEIKWFQKEDNIILKLKIRNVKDHKCTFSREGVIFSAWVGDKFYLADLQLHKSIFEEKSKCIIKNEEPMIILVKEKKEPWLTLLKHKSPNVSFDFDHWEEPEEESPFSNVVPAKRMHHFPDRIIEEMDDSSGDSESESD